ncbi:MAG: hypothetical protein KF730_01075 [Sphingomonas sp.]|uniref:hypothetical protein n=1 Tax=Sphingomonas sp. TaxID=28214 RepID=UPI0025DEA289|nr:hypothetical protein [Sphingomonas sp.]MBX3563144.1 hypothetical protein [Sphingomonas sp.]
MLLPIMLALQDSTNVAAAYAEYREKTSAVVRCRQPKDDGEIVVCATREAYRYQTPFVVSTRRTSNAHAQDDMVWTPEAQGFAECGKGAFIVHCGSVGASVTVSSGGGVRYKLR